MSFDDIKETYGLAKWRAIENSVSNEPDFGRGTFEEERNKFGTVNNYSAFYTDTTDVPHARLINRQYWKLHNREFYLILRLVISIQYLRELNLQRRRSMLKIMDSK